MHLDGILEVDVLDTVSFTFRVINDSDGPIELTFSDGQTADIAVYAVEKEVWRWSDSRMFTQASRRETLDPGSSLSHNATWPDPPSGTYTAEAWLTATNVAVEATAEFVVA